MDINEISALLHIHEKASAHGEALKHIKDAAWDQLKKANEEHGPKEEEPAEEAEEPVTEEE
jgi:hypothetical protein